MIMCTTHVMLFLKQYIRKTNLVLTSALQIHIYCKESLDANFKTSVSFGPVDSSKCNLFKVVQAQINKDTRAHSD